MFSDYTYLILDEYYTKLGQNKLPPSLLHLRPARLRDECLKVCEERFQPRDLKTLRDFFGVFDGKEECLKLIERIDVDKFRPLINYLNGDTESTNEKNIELLAWLIDFQPRPFELGRKYGRREDGGKEEGGMEDGPLQVAAEVLPWTSTAPLELAGMLPRKKTGLLKWVIPGAIAVVTVTGFSIMKLREKPPAIQTFVDTSTSCMYWTGEEYKAVPCNARPGTATIIALDTFQLNHFRKVMQIDTITLRSVGKLWYLKRNNFPEIFTAPGNHPEELNKQLRPLSAYMIKKYILKNDK
ncbi:hypothetical protein GCM10027036_32240 [Flavihumibacter cheonanensis]|uniref:hypothetical protein n=1 Tax=Flavihumibacter cheonanensis TaxID=1442385 RepID=UPI001EF97A5B|nr:hypothetical protein [Flavihumibacter cheonanensis]MCG7752750.1 hypothetical protein [Flavihumibacter cheonanensis]